MLGDTAKTSPPPPPSLPSHGPRGGLGIMGTWGERGVLALFLSALHSAPCPSELFAFPPPVIISLNYLELELEGCLEWGSGPGRASDGLRGSADPGHCQGHRTAVPRAGLPGKGMPGAEILGQRAQEQESLKQVPQQPGWQRRDGSGDPRNQDAGEEDARSWVPGAGMPEEEIPGTGSQERGRLWGPRPPPLPVSRWPRRRGIVWGGEPRETLLRRAGALDGDPRCWQARSLEGCRTSRAEGAAVPARPNFV